MSERMIFTGTAPDGSTHSFRSRRAGSKLQRHPKVKRLGLRDFKGGTERTLFWHDHNVVRGGEPFEA